jgi:hypothetical protein
MTLPTAVRKSTLAPVSILGATQPTHNPAALLRLRTLAEKNAKKFHETNLKRHDRRRVSVRYATLSCKLLPKEMLPRVGAVLALEREKIAFEGLLTGSLVLGRLALRANLALASR